MKPRLLTATALAILLSASFSRGAGKFQIFYPADLKYATDTLWVRQIKTWGATGVTLRVHRSMVEHAYHQYDWSQVRRALASVAGAGLDVDLRISTVFINGGYVDRYSRDDFHQTKGGEIYYNNNADRPLPILNLTSERAFGDLVRFYSELITGLRGAPGADRIRFVLPALNANDETEFPVARYGEPGWGWLSGYSAPEKEAFIRSLRIRYNGDPADSTPARLNAAWRSGFSSISTAEIRIDDYDWERLRPSYNSYPAGRKDFLDFRASQLKRFIDSCAVIVKGGGYRLGVQFGSIYDEGLDFRSTYDVTPLVENVGLVIVGDVAENGPNFNFVADYLRSLGRYWDWRKGRRENQRTLWGTETNWPGYDQIEPETLVRLWKQQVDSAYVRGGSVLSVFGWGTEGDNVSWKSESGVTSYSIADLVRKDSLDREDHEIKNTAYGPWRSYLGALRKKQVKLVKRTTAVHLSCEQNLYSRPSAGELSHTRNNRFQVGTLPTVSGSVRGTTPTMVYPLRKFAGMKSPYASSGPAYDGRCDLVTNFMIAATPSYLSQYKRFYLTATSYYMPDTVYNILLRRSPASAGRASSPPGVSASNPSGNKAGDSSMSRGLPPAAHAVRENEHGEARPADDLDRRVKRDPNLLPR